MGIALAGAITVTPSLSGAIPRLRKVGHADPAEPRPATAVSCKHRSRFGPQHRGGNLSGLFGPYAMGWIKDATGSFSGGLLLIAAFAVIAMMIVLALGQDRALERAPVAVRER